tara:strand:+ start:532 stop:1401 length:870 start_codon:yes stop_codon:yes gene_type:complete
MSSTTKYNIGIIGKGFVGSAVAFGFSPSTGYDSNIRVYDTDESKSTHSLSEVLHESEFIFLSVPTPSNQNGSINLDIVHSLFEEMNNLNTNNNSIILLRSTVTPGTTRELQNRYGNLNIVFNPEFLTERSSKLDFINPARHILGGNSTYTQRVAELYKDRFGQHCPIIQTDFETAELTKYACNIYFATKVSFMNEMKSLSDVAGGNWDDLVDGLSLDGRIGHSHLAVPGPDGKRGFGGSCFPKDIQAIIHYAESNGVNPNVIKGAWETNLEVRPEQDWKELKGRAVVDE